MNRIGHFALRGRLMYDKGYLDKFIESLDVEQLAYVETLIYACNVERENEQLQSCYDSFYIEEN